MRRGIKFQLLQKGVIQKVKPNKAWYNISIIANRRHPESETISGEITFQLLQTDFIQNVKLYEGWYNISIIVNRHHPESETV